VAGIAGPNRAELLLRGTTSFDLAAHWADDEEIDAEAEEVEAE
jgi:hypothetical protein